MSDSLLKLANPPFTISFDGKDYEVRKANITKVVLYQERVKKLAAEDSVGVDTKLVAYALFLILKDAIPDITEEKVSDTVQGDIDIIQTLIDLGFVNPAKAKALLTMMVEATKKQSEQTTPTSTVPSPNAQDGLPT